MGTTSRVEDRTKSIPHPGKAKLAGNKKKSVWVNEILYI